MSLSKKWGELTQLIFTNNPQGLDEATKNLLESLTNLTASFDAKPSDDIRDEIKSKLKKLNTAVYQPPLQNNEKIQKAFHDFFTLFIEKTSPQTPPAWALMARDPLINIFGRLVPEDLVALSRVSHRFYSLTNTESLWENIRKSRPIEIIPLQPRKSYTENFVNWHNRQYKALGPITRGSKTIYPDVSSATRKLFSLVLNNDIEGLKANEEFITIDSLYELDRHRQSYLTIAQEKKYLQISAFIVATLEKKAKDKYWKMKLDVALTRIDNPDLIKKTWQKLIPHFYGIRHNRYDLKPSYKLARLIIENDDRQALAELLGDIEQFRLEPNIFGGGVTWWWERGSPTQLKIYEIYLPSKIAAAFRSGTLKNEFIDKLLCWIANDIDGKIILVFIELILEFAIKNEDFHLTQHIVNGLIARNVSLNAGFLSIALRYGNDKIIGHLLNNKDRLKININDERAACLYAALERDLKYSSNPTELRYVRWLTEFGAEYPVVGNSSKNSLGCLKLLEKESNRVIISTILNFFTSRFKCEINSLSDENNSTLLHLAFFDKNYDLAIELLTLPTDVNLKDRLGRTSLHCYVFALAPYILSPATNSDFIKSRPAFYGLLRLGADPTKKDTMGNTVINFCNTHGTKQTLLIKILEACQTQADFKQFVAEAQKQNNQNAEEYLVKAITGNYSLTYLLLQDLLTHPAVPVEHKQQFLNCYRNTGKIEDYDLRKLKTLLVNNSPSFRI